MLWLWVAGLGLYVAFTVACFRAARLLLRRRIDPRHAAVASAGLFGVIVILVPPRAPASTEMHVTMGTRALTAAEVASVEASIARRRALDATDATREAWAAGHPGQVPPPFPTVAPALR